MAIDDDMQTFQRKVVTNADRIRSMGNEQLAEFLHGIIQCCTADTCRGNQCSLYWACGQDIERQKQWLEKEAT
jgi:hypothetical protein